VRDAKPGLQPHLVEEMTEWPVAQVMEEPVRSCSLEQIRGERDGREPLGQALQKLGDALKQVSSQFPRHVHRAEGVAEPAVGGARVDKPRGLQLVDAPQPLYPTALDKIRLGCCFVTEPSREPDVPVDWVADEVPAGAWVRNLGLQGAPPVSRTQAFERLERSARDGLLHKEPSFRARRDVLPGDPLLLKEQHPCGVG